VEEWFPVAHSPGIHEDGYVRRTNVKLGNSQTREYACKRIDWKMIFPWSFICRKIFPEYIIPRYNSDLKEDLSSLSTTADFRVNVIHIDDSAYAELGKRP